MTAKLKITWRNRFDALTPSAVIGFGESARHLKSKLLSMNAERLSGLQGVFGENLLFAAGAAENLPWADGVIYLGKDALAPTIFLPTNLRPNIPVDLFEKSLLAQFAAQQPFVVVENRVVKIGKMLPISRIILEKF